ncbi:hypothetical protein L0F81_22405 [Streptomyces tricolor]|uniref:DNA-binding protein n=1 Tax=Streptomyces tricolor TaxID=68277 RepID=A0ABS9JKC8_9ACTN|nr:hypothetical protein [Streptomyces tricolor]MCG0066015.1 hypothetical protein [Streptomyces tricolor]
MTEDEARGLLQQRLAALGERITLADIAAATGRTPHYIRHYWANTPERGFPSTRGSRTDGTKEFDRDQVADWCHRNGIGVQLHASEIEDTRRDWVTTADIAERLGLRDRSAVRYHARKHAAGSPDPYPAPDEDGRRYWPDVLAWHQRHEKAPRTKPGPQPTAGLTPRLHRVQLLVEAAKARGETLTARALAGELGIHEDSAYRLLRNLARATGAE